jgi:hypothetical protein
MFKPTVTAPGTFATVAKTVEFVTLLRVKKHHRQGGEIAISPALDD